MWINSVVLQGHEVVRDDPAGVGILQSSSLLRLLIVATGYEASRLSERPRVAYFNG